MPQTPAEVLARNKRKVEKDKRRLAYHDLQVQGTNNSSIVSKRSVEAIYNPKLEPSEKMWIKHFVPKAKRRSPAINRGYWIRMESIKQMIFRIQKLYLDPNVPVRVVNLGCGFDTLAYQFLDGQYGNFEFFDFDYPELVQRKLNVIRDSPEILEVIGTQEELSPEQSKMGIVMATDSYKLVGCDLKNTERYNQQLSSLLSGKSNAVTIFIAEVSLAYMKPEDANPVVEISSEISKSHFLVLEQIMPSGPDHFFARKMLYHFSHLRSPLQCVERYNTKDLQKERFQSYFPSVEIKDLFECWQDLVPRSKRKAVAEIEEFDEWEEFIVFCQHYVVIHATNSTHLVFKPLSPIEEILSSSKDVKTIHIGLDDLELKFASSCKVDDKFMIHGGLFQTRTDELLEINSSCLEHLVVPVSGEKPAPRMCHTLTNVENGYLVLTGGRGRPGLIFDDVWVYEIAKQTWRLVGQLPEPMFRHSAICISPGKVLVYGEGKFVEINLEGEISISTLRALGHVPLLNSCAFTFDPRPHMGYIVGGMADDIEPRINKELFRYLVTDDAVVVEPVLESNYLARIGCMGILKDDKLVVLGGAGHVVQDQHTTVLAVDTTCWSIEKVTIAEEEWKKAPVFIGAGLAGNTVLGGGAVCYSFGSAYNNAYEIEIT